MPIALSAMEVETDAPTLDGPVCDGQCVRDDRSFSKPLNGAARSCCGWPGG